MWVVINKIDSLVHSECALRAVWLVTVQPGVGRPLTRFAYSRRQAVAMAHAAMNVMARYEKRDADHTSV